MRGALHRGSCWTPQSESCSPAKTIYYPVAELAHVGISEISSSLGFSFSLTASVSLYHGCFPEALRLESTPQSLK